uniref:Importinlike protein putative n=1 Tax=Albugo laibachii Nc14 TaxID=890382 RepID=F0W5X9_9STRA|nr:importinlike protein putative [Albugo laibachii Nc14]|eukprot:CCA16520.1 importinlike protein putative [Albugo laibachii Nc14]
MESLLTSLTSNDNAQRAEAEERYKKVIQNDPQSIVIEFIQLIENSTDIALRTSAVVLLRRLLDVHACGVYARLDAQTQTTVKSKLLEAIVKESVPSLRRKLGHTIAEVALASYTQKQAWNEILQLISEVITNSEQAQLCETGFDLITKLADYVGDILLPYKSSFLEAFMTSLQDPSGCVQISGLKAAASFLLLLDNQQDLAAFLIVMPSMLRIIENLFKSQEELVLREILSSFIQVAEAHPKFFKSALEQLGNAMLVIMTSQEMSPETRDLALELVVTICENASGTVRKSSQFIQMLLPTTLQLICEVEDDPEWKLKFDSPDMYMESHDDENIVSEAGANAITRLSIALGGKSILPVVIPVIRSYLADQDWRKRRAALYATCLLGEGSKAQLESQLASVVGMIMPYLEDGHPRVQYSAIYCIGQLANDFGVVSHGKNFLAQFHAIILPALTSILQKQECVPRTRALAASAVINCCDPNGCKAKHVLPYAQSLLESLFHVIQNGPRPVQEQALTAVANVAKVIGSGFDAYYDIFIPVAKNVLIHASGSEFSLLRGKSMETIALIGQAVGKDRFLNDAKEVMEILLQVQQTGTLNGPEVLYVTQSCVRIGSVLGNDFVPYLQHVIPPLIAQAQIEPDVQVYTPAIGEDDAESNVDDDVMIIQIRDNEKRQVRINTSALEDKTNACNMLYQCAFDVQGAFYPYVDQVAQVMIPLIRFQYVEDIRLVCSLSMAKLLDAAIEGILHHGFGKDDPQFPQRLFDGFFQTLIDAIQNEDDLECMGAFAEAIASSLEVCKDAADKGLKVGVSIENLPLVVDILTHIAVGCIQRRLVRVESNQQDEDFDQEEAIKQSVQDEVEDGIFRSMIDAVGWVIKVHKTDFFSVFQSQLLSFVMEYVNLTQIPAIRAQIICMMDDIIEHCQPLAAQHMTSMASHLLAGIQDPSAVVIQAAAYGIGVAAEKANQAFLPYASDSLQKLIQLILALREYLAHNENEETGAAHDNCVSAVLKLLVYYPNIADTKTLWSLWLSWLPLIMDIIEARDVHDRMLQLVSNNYTDLYGSEYSNLPGILKVLAALLDPNVSDNNEVTNDEEEYSIVSATAKPQIHAILLKFRTEIDEAVLVKAWGSLTMKEQQHLQCS